MATLASLWEAISQKLHAIVDRALEERSLALYDQHVRDVEAYRRQVEESAAVLYAGIQANKRRLEQHRATATGLDARLNQLLLAGQEEGARLLQGDLQVQQELVTTTERQIAHQEADLERLQTGRSETQERLQVMRGERPAVESLLAVVRAGKLIEQIELTLAGLAGLGDQSDAGRIASGIMRRFDEADARWQLAMTRIGADEASIQAQEAQIDDQLAERMRRLGLGGEG